MYHQHFNSIASTQIYLKDNLEGLKLKATDILISCTEQTDGVGRRGNSWQSFSNSLALSFTLKPNRVPSLTPIEVGLMTIAYFKKHSGIDLTLKWPNDILTRDKQKCGGIICQYIDESTVLVGLGLNLGKFDKPEQTNFRHGLASIDHALELHNDDQKKISSELYLEFLNSRISDTDELRDTFNKHCLHLDKEVYLFEDGKDFIGRFKGIGENGEALVEIDSTIQKFLSSSLTLLD